MSNEIGSVRYVAVKSSNSAQCQAQWSDGSQETPMQTCPFVLDLNNYGIKEGVPFQLHNDVHGEHKHGGPFVFSATGGLLTIHIRDAQGHYDDAEYFNPVS